MTLTRKHRERSEWVAMISRSLLLAFALGIAVALISLGPFHGHAKSLESPKALTEAIPNPTPEDITIEPSQMARGTSHTILINLRDCPNKKFGEANTVISEGDLNGLKGKGLDITGAQKLGDCRFSAELKVADSALFGPVAITIHFKEGDSDQTRTLVIRVVSEEPTPPGPLVPGLDPQVDVMWSVVPQSVAKDNFGQRVGKLFYCVEVVIGNNTGYDLQIAAVGFQLGPTGKHAETVVKTSQQAAKLMQTAQDESLRLAFEKIPDTCKARTKGTSDPSAYLNCITTETQKAIEDVSAGQARIVASLQNQRDFLATLPPNNPKSKLPASSYRMTRGSIEHGQFWNLRDTSLRLLKALGPLLTGFTPYFHVLTHQRNYAEAINIISNPLEKGIELVFPDETVQQLQRLDEQTLRDGMIIQNNRQIRTRTFIPKDVLHLEKYRDDPATVMMALGKLHIIGDLIEYKNRISVTTNPSGEVIPPPTVNQTEYVRTIGDADQTFNVSGTFLDGARLESDDPVNIKFGSTSSTQKTASAALSITEKATVGPHTFRLITKGGMATIPVTLTQPPPELADVNPRTFDGPSPKVNDTPGTEYSFTVTGKFFQGAQLAPANEATNKALELVKSRPDVSDGGTKLHSSFRLREGATAETYHFSITNPENPDQKTDLPIPVGLQAPPSIDADGVKRSSENPPPALKKSQVDLTVTGDNLYNAKLEVAPASKNKGVTITGIENKEQKTLKAHIAVDQTAKAGDYTLNLTNSRPTTETNPPKAITFTVGPQEDVKVTEIEPKTITSSAEEQKINIKIKGSNLRETHVDLPDTNWKLQTEDVKASTHESESGEELILDVIVPKNVAVSKATFKIKNTTDRIEERKIDIVAPPTPPAPTVTKFQNLTGDDVDSGKVGDTVVILGTNLKSATTVVKFKDVTATVPAANIEDSKITVTIPSGLTPSETAIDVTVTTAGGTSPAKKFTIRAP